MQGNNANENVVNDIINHNDQENHNLNSESNDLNSGMLNKLLNSSIKGIKYNDKINVFKVNCTICLENFNSDSLVIKLFCKHIFHFQCLKNLMIKNKHKSELKCPNCNNEAVLASNEVSSSENQTNKNNVNYLDPTQQLETVQLYQQNINKCSNSNPCDQDSSSGIDRLKSPNENESLRNNNRNYVRYKAENILESEQRSILNIDRNGNENKNLQDYHYNIDDINLISDMKKTQSNAPTNYISNNSDNTGADLSRQNHSKFFVQTISNIYNNKDTNNKCMFHNISQGIHTQRNFECDLINLNKNSLISNSKNPSRIISNELCKAEVQKKIETNKINKNKPSLNVVKQGADISVYESHCYYNRDTIRNESMNISDEEFNINQEKLVFSNIADKSNAESKSRNKNHLIYNCTMCVDKFNLAKKNSLGHKPKPSANNNNYNNTTNKIRRIQYKKFHKKIKRKLLNYPIYANIDLIDDLEDCNSEELNKTI